MNTKPSKRGLYTSIIGTIFIAICCFTPILVILLVAVGLGFFTPYLDYILYPALALMLLVTFLSYRKWKRECDEREKEQTLLDKEKQHG